MKKIEFTQKFTLEKEEGQLDIFGNVKGKERDYFGEELSDWFGKPMFSIYKKFGRNRSERIFNEMQKINDHNITHLMQRLNHD